MISRVSLVKSAPRFASLAPFCRLICDHLLCPDIGSPSEPSQPAQGAFKGAETLQWGSEPIVPIHSANPCQRGSPRAILPTDVVRCAARPGNAPDLPHNRLSAVAAVIYLVNGGRAPVAWLILAAAAAFTAVFVLWMAGAGRAVRA